jgi:phosphohistidine swiveling domain-containing protein
VLLSVVPRLARVSIVTDDVSLTDDVRIKGGELEVNTVGPLEVDVEVVRLNPAIHIHTLLSAIMTYFV